MPATKVKFVLPAHTIRSLNAAERDLTEALSALDEAWNAMGRTWCRSPEGRHVNDWLHTLSDGLSAIGNVRRSPD